MTVNNELPVGWSLKGVAQKYLATAPHNVGDTVQLGWFVFRVSKNSIPPELESLDFKQMASFTTDFSAAEKIRSLQTDVLAKLGVAAEGCTLTQTALVSRSYHPGKAEAFLERQQSSEKTDSGWYVGTTDDDRDMNHIESFTVKSLYELSIADPRMLPFWLLPFGKKVMLSNGAVR